MTPIRTHHINGRLETETWRNEAGAMHRLNDPAWRGWHESGRLWFEGWYINGRLHKLDGPAYQEWVNNGQLNREEWRINGVQYDTEAEFQVAVDLYKANEIADLF